MPSLSQDLDTLLDARTTGRDDFQRALAFKTKKVVSVISIVCPENLDEIDHWVVFRINKPVLMKKNDFERIEDIVRIFLPMPASLGTQYSQTYNGKSIGPAGAAAAANADALAGGVLNGDIKTIISTIGNTTLDSLVGSAAWYAHAGVQEGLAAGFGAALGLGKSSLTQLLATAAGAAAGQTYEGVVAGKGIARNPYMAVMYESPGLREHTFSWKFTPKSEKESKLIQEIITRFKYHSSPGVNSSYNQFIDYPEQFDIDFHYDKYLYNIGPSVCTAFEVDYHDGQPLYFDIGKDKAPVSITMKATFKEVAIITKNEIIEQRR